MRARREQIGIALTSGVVVPITVVVMALALAGCAGATVGSGVGDRWLSEPPYYAGAEAAFAPDRLLTTLQWRVGDVGDPTGRPGSAVAALLDDIRAVLEVDADRFLLSGEGPGVAPDVLFGCETDGLDECVEREGPSRRSPPLRLAVARPSGSWVTWMQEETTRSGADATLVLTLEVSRYWPYQKNFRGDKEVALGTDHVVGVPWLTALDAPVSVLQITGALVDGSGRAVRIGAEGMMVRPSHIVASGFGLERVITDEDVAALRLARRADLPGSPLVWEVALRELVAGLTGGEVRVAPRP